MELTPQIRLEARKELARRFFWDYCKLKYPKHFNEERAFLKDVCQRVQAFSEQNTKRFLIVNEPPRHYKALEIATPVLTTRGWVRHGELLVGDYVFAPDGKPVRVTHVHPIHDHESMSVEFTTGEEIIASTLHEWLIEVDRGRRVKGKKVGREPLLIETQDIMKGYNRRSPLIRLAAPLDMPDKDLPLDPYILGIWLGDGSKDFGLITVGDEDLGYFSQFGSVRKCTSAWAVTINGLRRKTRELGVYRNKHIPDMYMTASYGQRLALLQGLMDTDGSVHRDYYRCVFVQKSYDISLQVLALCRSLGIKATMRKYRNRVYDTDYYHVSFTTDTEVFRLPRKLAILREHKGIKSKVPVHFIKSIKPVGKRTVNCITVEGGLYLAGKGLIPTHNSFSAGNFVEWRFGADPTRKVMTGSYNETLSATFARKVRDTIDERPSTGILTYGDIFPRTRVKYGQASAAKWALEGSGQDNYLATSPTGTATGFGANDIVIDDIIKNAEEAYNEAVLEKHFSWFTNTMLSRTEGDDWKVYLFMTRWAQGDLAGRIIEAFPDEVEVITYTAVQSDGSMLCDAVLNRHDYDLKTKEMNQDIVEANYNQQPIDVKGRLYSDFIEYDTLPEGKHKKWNYTDTADQGDDFLCSVDYIEHDGDVYVTDVVMTDEGMEDTEPAVAEMLDVDEVDEAIVESNNGGRGFARNVGRILKEERYNQRCIITWTPQTQNKQSRILASSAWVNRHIAMPHNWQHKWPVFYKQLMNYQKKGKNKHDDAPDVLAAIYERVVVTQTDGIEILL